MADRLERLRQLAQRLKERVHLSQINNSSREKVDHLIRSYVPAANAKVNEIAERFRQEAIGKKFQDLVSRYEKFTGVEEIMAIQNTVIEAQERFMQAQDQRRDLGRQVASIEARLKELHAEMQNTMKGDDKYLHLCTEEHKLIIQERALRSQFSEAEREERELFATMSAAVKLGHERERAHAERNKYWYIVASIFGTVLGIAGSTINNRLKMAEFRDMMEQQMARSASVLYTVAGGGAASRADITDAMKTEFAYQAKLAENLKIMQDSVNTLIGKQTSLIDHLNHQEHATATQIKELKRLVVMTSQASAKSDAELAKALSVVHQDLDDADREKERDRERETGVIPQPTVNNKVLLEPNQVLTGIGVILFAAIVFGNIFGRIS